MLREIRRFKPFSPAERNSEENHGVLGCQRVDLLVVGDNLKEAYSYTLLRHGMKGILNYAEAREQLPRALALVASNWLLGASQAAFTLRRFHPEHCARSTHRRKFGVRA